MKFKNCLAVSEVLSFRAHGNGGAIMAYDQSKVHISAVLEANFARGYGGGLASVGSSSIVLTNGAMFRNNSAFGNGGGFFAAGLGTTIGDLCRFLLFRVLCMFPFLCIKLLCMTDSILGQLGHQHLKHASVTWTVVQSMQSQALNFITTGLPPAHFSQTRLVSVVEQYLPGILSSCSLVIKHWCLTTQQVWTVVDSI